MTTLEKVNRLKKYIEARQDNLPVVDLTIEKLIDREQDRLAKDQRELSEELVVFEERFGQTSAEFFEQYQNGQKGDEIDLMEWAAVYKMYLKTQVLLETLS